MAFFSRLFNPSSSLASPSTSLPAEQRLASWAAANNIRSAGSLDASPDGSRGLFLPSSASSKLSKGTPLVSVPYRLALTQERAVELCQSTKDIDQLPEWSAIAALLLESRASPAAPSFYREYAASLPSTSGCILEWTPAELDLFQRSSTARLKAQEILAAYEHAVGQLEPLLDPSLSLSSGDYRWAFSMLLSRLVRLQGRGGVQALVPWADMLNHSASAQGAYLDVSPSDPLTITVPAARDFLPGQELFISYGDKGSAEFLLSYGFVPSDRDPATEAAQVPLSLQRDDPQFDLKARLLAQCDLPPQNALFPLRQGALPLEMMGYAALSVTRVSSEFEALGILQGRGGGEREEVRSRASRVLLEAVRSSLASLPSASLASTGPGSPAAKSLDSSGSGTAADAPKGSAGGGRGKGSKGRKGARASTSARGSGPESGSGVGKEAREGSSGSTTPSSAVSSYTVRPWFRSAVEALSVGEARVLQRWEAMLTAGLRASSRR